MIILALLLVIFICIGSVSSASLNTTDEDKVLKSSNSSSSITAKTATLGTATKANETKTTTAKQINATTVNKKTLARASTGFMNSVEKNGKFPKVKISNKNYSNTEYLYLISKSVENESKSKIEIKNNLVKPYINTKQKSVKGTINKTEYVYVAKKTRTFIEKNHRAPNWASSSKGNIPYNQLILLFSKCLDTYNKTNKLPASVKLDDLDLEKIKDKINQKNAKSATTTAKSNATKTSTTKKNTSTTTKKANATKTSTVKTTTAKKNTTTSTTKKSNGTTSNTGTNKAEGKGSLIERSMAYVHSLLNNIFDKLDPSKYKIDASRSAESNIKFNTSKINVDMSGKSAISLKLTPVGAKTTIKKVSTAAKAASQKVSTTAKSTIKKASTTAKKTVTTALTKAKQTNKTNATSTKKASSKTASKTTKTKITIPTYLKKYLSSSKNCQVTNKQIQDLAKKLTSKLKTEYSKGNKIFKWVRDNIKYEKYANTRKGASKTLKKKAGNCVDQSHLLIALSRAVGIPARYVNGGNCKFTSGYVSGHVWAQMYINKKWVVADPTSYRNKLGKIKNWNTKSYTHYGEYSAISF